MYHEPFDTLHINNLVRNKTQEKPSSKTKFNNWDTTSAIIFFPNRERQLLNFKFDQE